MHDGRVLADRALYRFHSYWASTLPLAAALYTAMKFIPHRSIGEATAAGGRAELPRRLAAILALRSRRGGPAAFNRQFVFRAKIDCVPGLGAGAMTGNITDL